MCWYITQSAKRQYDNMSTRGVMFRKINDFRRNEIYTELSKPDALFISDKTFDYFIWYIWMSICQCNDTVCIVTALASSKDT